jgi:integrase
MATRPKTGSRNGVEWRTTTKGEVRWRAVLNTKHGKQSSGWLGTREEAATWRAKALTEAGAGIRRQASAVTLREAWNAFYEAACAGTVTDRSGKPYKPSTLRGYQRAWKRIDAEIGGRRLDSIRRPDLQAMVDRWAAAGVKPATIRNSLDPLRTIYRRALLREQVAVNPTVGLDVPRVNNMRERFATREEAAALIAALPEGERALWATAFYGGLRRGELRAMPWTHIDLAAGLIHVRRSWDDVEGDSEPKTKAAIRRVPITPPLLALLKAHQRATGRSGDDLVFGRTAADPFIPSTVRNRALAAWKAAELQPIGLHEARHTFASLLIASGANAKALSVVMGHESITITFDRYGKLMPGGEAEVGRLLGEYLQATPTTLAAVA